MNLAFRLKMAKQQAEAFLRENGYSTLPIDPFVIAEKLDIVVQPKSDAADGRLRDAATARQQFRNHVCNALWQ